MAEEPEHTGESDETPRLDWSSAQVDKGTLVVALSGELTDPWRGVFERTVTLLGGGDWDEVELKSEQVQVTGVHEGVEESLRHFLEGVVQEANATTLARNQEEDEKDEPEAEHDDGDSRMTERFRDLGS